MTPVYYRKTSLKQMRAKRWRTTRPLESMDGRRVASGGEVRVVLKQKGRLLAEASRGPGDRLPLLLICELGDLEEVPG